MFTIAAIGAGLVGSAIGGATGWNAAKVKQSYNDVRNTLNNTALADWKVEDVLSNMYSAGAINNADYKKYMNTIQTLDDKDGKGFTSAGLGGKKTQALMELYGKVQDYIPEIRKTMWDVTANLPDDARNAFVKGLPKIGGPAAPKYFDTNFEGYQRDIEPRKLWTAQELAEHHDLDYNLDNIYDKIKAGTKAQLDTRRFESDQILTGALGNQGAQDAAYLNQIRDIRGEALQKGATLGAIKANELLANLNKQAGNVQKIGAAQAERFKNVNDAMRMDADAYRMAAQEYEQMGRQFAGTSQYLYANDAERFANDWLANAKLFAGDQNYRGNLHAANANMYNAYVQAAAQASAANTMAQQGTNDLKAVYDILLNKNKFNVENTSRDFEKWILNQNTGALGFYDYYANAQGLN